MKALKLIPIILIAGVASLCAEDLTTSDGTVYTGIKITSVEPEALVIQHDGGIARIHFGNLPKEWQAKYNYDPVKAAEKSKKAKEIQETQRQIRIIVRRVETGGVFAETMEAKAIATVGDRLSRVGGGGYTSAGADITWEGSGEIIFLEGLRNAREQQELDIVAYPDGVHTVTTNGNKEMILKWVFLHRR